MNKKLLFVLILILQFSIFFGCRNDSELLQPDDSQRLIIYTSHKEEVYEPIIREFENRTGIWVTVITGGTNELLDQIASGSAAGRCDLMFGGGIESLMSCIDSFESYTCENRSFLLPEYEISDSRITPFSALPIVLIYNTRLIESTELKGWSSLLDPTLCGQIAFANPAVSGSSYTMLCTLCQILGGNPSLVLHDFAKNLDGKQLSGSGSVLDAVADGILPVGITLEETARKRIDEGAPIGMIYPEEGTSSVPDGCAVLISAPHPENARKLIDFIMGEDVQNLLVRSMYRRSVRSDIAKLDGMPSEAEIGLIAYDYQWSSMEHDSNLALWAEYTGGAS